MNLIKVSQEQEMGQYKTTTVDTLKANADILIEYANGGSFTIKLQKQLDLGSKRGIKAQCNNNTYEVTENKLNQLRKVYNVQANF